MRTCVILALVGVCTVACSSAAPIQMTEAPAVVGTRTLTLPPITLSQHYVASQLPVEFDYPDGWAVQEYLGTDYVHVKWILVSDQEAFFSDPLDPENAGILITMITWSNIVSLDAALLTPEPSRLTKVTPDPLRVAETISFYSGWTNGYCVGIGCAVDLNLSQSIELNGRQAATGNGKMYFCRDAQLPPEQVGACELDLYGVIVETAHPNIYIGLYGKGPALLQDEDLLRRIAATLEFGGAHTD